jgi:hypothetical protein
MAAMGARVRRGVKGVRRSLGGDVEEWGGCVVVGGVWIVEGAEVVDECGLVIGWVEGFGGEGPEEDITGVEGGQRKCSLGCRRSSRVGCEVVVDRALVWRV